MTNSQELTLIWDEMTRAHQHLNSTTSTASKAQLKSLIEMYRIEYRSLTSRYA